MGSITNRELRLYVVNTVRDRVFSKLFMHKSGKILMDITWANDNLSLRDTTAWKGQLRFCNKTSWVGIPAQLLICTLTRPSRVLWIKGANNKHLNNKSLASMQVQTLHYLWNV